MKDKNYKKYYIATLVFFVFSILIMGPLSIYLPNSEELSFSLTDVLSNILVVCLTFIVIAILVNCIVPQKYKGIFLALFFACSLFLYVQGNFFPNNYGTGVLDGTAVDWETHRLSALENFAFFVAVLVGILIFYESNKKALLYISIASLFFTLIQIPALVVQVLNYNPKKDSTLIVDKENEFVLSNDENIILFVLDTMDEQYFASYEKNHPEIYDKMSGFVHYDNAFTAGARTPMAMPIFFTGQPFLREQVYSEYIDSVYSKGNILTEINNSGYDVRVYSESLYFSPSIVENVSNFSLSNHPIGINATLVKKLYKVTLYKYLPVVFKPFFFFDTSEFQEINNSNNTDIYACDDLQFFEDLKTSADFDKSGDKKVFVTYHLNGAHSPYRMNSIGLKDAASTKESQIEGVFYVVLDYLDRLKENGLYDNSTIIITADHGDSQYDQHPILFIKDKNSTAPYTTSHKPVSLFDIPLLISNLTDVSMNYNIYGTDIDSLGEDEVRTRHLFVNTTRSSQINIIEYVSDSAAGDEDSIILMNTYEDFVNAETPYVLGTELSFEADATGNIYGVDGFGKNTGFRTMLRGPKSTLEIPFEKVKSQKDIKAFIELHPISKKGYKLIILADGNEVYSDVIDADAVAKGIVFSIPQDCFKDNRIQLDFLFPEIDEKELGLEIGRRTETISFKTIVFE